MKEITVNIKVVDCTECPYYYGMMMKKLEYTYGKCEKTGGIGKNKNLIANCPYRCDEEPKIDKYIETDYHSYWKVHMADYIDDLIRKRLKRILEEEDL